jgi:hypothetical protein
MRQTDDFEALIFAGGADRPSNVQWQAREKAKIKDRREREMCRGKR